MKIKETICTEMDSRGNVIRRTRTVDIDDLETDRGYDYGTRYGDSGDLQRGSIKRIFEAYDDYCKSRQW